jgi:hypothetical protein
LAFPQTPSGSPKAILAPGKTISGSSKVISEELFLTKFDQAPRSLLCRAGLTPLRKEMLKKEQSAKTNHGLPGISPGG